MSNISHRIHRLQGQLSSIDAAIADGAACSDVIPQLLAIKGAVAAMTQVYLEQSLDDCLDTADTDQMRQVMKTLIKNT